MALDILYPTATSGFCKVGPSSVVDDLLHGTHGIKQKDTPVVKPNIVVVGGSYVGCKTVDYLAPAFHETHNIILIEKNSHFQHIFAFPRFSVYPGLEDRAFVPLNNPFPTAPPKAARVIRGAVERVEHASPVPGKPWQNGVVVLEDGTEVPWEYLIYTTGTGREGGAGIEKADGMKRLRNLQEEVKAAKRIVVAGGGAWGIQVALDIAEYLPEKEVTLVHSRATVMNRFHPKLHEIVMDKFASAGVKARLSVRLVTPPEGYPTDGRAFNVQLSDGTSIEADCLVQCTGTVPLSKPLSYLSPASINDWGFVKVKPTMQIQDEHFPKVFSLGDVADTGAHKAARPAYEQAPVVEKNIRKIMAWEHERQREYRGEPLDLVHYKVPGHGIHLALGLSESVLFRNPVTPGADPVYQISKDDAKALDAGCWRIWANRAPTVTDFRS